METKMATGFWWLKNRLTADDSDKDLVVPKLDLKTSTSLVDLLEKDKGTDSDVDVGSIIEEINRVAAQSPLGPYERSVGDRSVDDIMKEAEKIYMESSKSFEQLSQRSRTSLNISDLLSNLSKDSTPTPKSVSPLPTDPNPDIDSQSDEDYTEDFSEESRMVLNPSPEQKKQFNLQEPFENEEKDISDEEIQKTSVDDDLVASKSASKTNQVSSNVQEGFSSISIAKSSSKSQISILDDKNSSKKSSFEEKYDKTEPESCKTNAIEVLKLYENSRLEKLNEVIELKNNLIRTLQDDNASLKYDIQEIKLELQKNNLLLGQTKQALNSKTVSSPEISLELERALEDLKDSKEISTALQLQLDNVNKSHQLLKSSYDDLVSSNRNLERKCVELDSALEKYRTEITNLLKAKDKLAENEVNITKFLEIEKLQSKSLKLQNDKDAKCIQDLNRQIKEMERIIARKHPDSVSALIVAAKENVTDTNLTARKILEDRIKSLEQEQLNRESQSSKVFLEIQEKFNQMKAKYENHIEDLELHVSDLKNQLKKKIDSYDVYTQTFVDEKIPRKETFTVSTQTNPVQSKPPRVAIVKRQEKPQEGYKEDAHLVATIRGLQADLTNKEKVINRLQKEVDDLRKTNRRLQKEREGSLRSLSERKEFRSYPEKLATQSRSNSGMSVDFRKEEELLQAKADRDRLKQQLNRLELDYQALKAKRIDDLTALQEAHETEVSNYIASVTPLKDQLELQQVSISALQSQLISAREELAVVTLEKEQLNARLLNIPCGASSKDSSEVEVLLKKIAYLEKRYEERECRLKVIVQSLAQKNLTNRSCEQCAERQRELIGYKVELDQLLATVRALH